MINQILDLSVNKEEKEKFWSFIIVWASFNLLKQKGINVLICGQNKVKNEELYSKIFSYVYLQEKISKKFIKTNEDEIVSLWLGSIKFINYDEICFMPESNNFIYFSEFYENENYKIKNIENIKNSIIVYDGKPNQNIESSCFYLTMKFKDDLKNQIWNFDSEMTNHRSLIWDTKENKHYELFYLKNEKSQLYYSLFLNSNNATEMYVNKHTKGGFWGQRVILGIETNSHEFISLSLMFEISYQENKKITVFENLTVISQGFLDRRNSYIKNIYRTWISEGHIIILGEKKIDLNSFQNLLNNLKAKYKIVRIVYRDFNLTTRRLVKEYIVKNGIFDKEKIIGVKNQQDIWHYLQIFQGKIFSKEIHFLNKDFMFKQFLNFNAKQVNDEWEIRRISNSFPWEGLFSSLICIGQKTFLNDFVRTKNNQKSLQFEENL